MNLDRYKKTEITFIAACFVLIVSASLWVMICIKHFGEDREWHVTLLGWICVISLPPYVVYSIRLIRDAIRKDHDDVM